MLFAKPTKLVDEVFVASGSCDISAIAERIMDRNEETKLVDRSIYRTERRSPKRETGAVRCGADRGEVLGIRVCRCLTLRRREEDR